MSYSSGKQQAPLLQQPTYPIYPQGYPYDKSELVPGAMPDGRAAALNPAGGRYPQPGTQHMYRGGGPTVDGNAAAVAYQHQQQQQQQQMRSQAGGMAYGGRGSGGGRGPQATFGGMPVPPPGGGPPHFLQGSQQGTQPLFLVNVPQQQAVMQNPGYMPVPMQYQMPTGYMQSRPQGPGGYPQPQVWGQQQPGPAQMYGMQPQQHPPRAMPAMPQPAAPAPQQPAQPSRASKRIAIINPNTGEEVSMAKKETPAANAASGDKSTDAAAAQGNRQVAAEFAKMVAQAATSRSRTSSEAAEPPPAALAPATEQLNGAVSTPPGAGPPPPTPAETPPEKPPAAAPAPAAAAPAAAAPAPASPAAASAPAAPAAAPAQQPAPVEEEGRSNSQKKTKNKQKMRELNRRAEGKEGGGDMDAFVVADAKLASERPPAAGPAPAAAPVATKPATAAAAVAAPPAAKPAPAAAAATPAPKPAVASASAAKQTPPVTSASAQKQTPAAAPPATKQAPAPAAAAVSPKPTPAPAKQTAPAAAAKPAAKPSQDAPAAKQAANNTASPLKPNAAKPAPEAASKPAPAPQAAAASKPAASTAPAPKKAAPKPAAEPAPKQKPARVEKAPEKPTAKSAPAAAAAPEAAAAAPAQKAAPAAVEVTPAAPAPAAAPAPEPAAPAKESTPTPAATKTKPTPAAAEAKPAAPAEAKSAAPAKAKSAAPAEAKSAAPAKAKSAAPAEAKSAAPAEAKSAAPAEAKSAAPAEAKSAAPAEVKSAAPAEAKSAAPAEVKSAAPAEAKSAAPAEAKSAAPAETKPAASVEAKPAASVEAKPAASVEAKPATPAEVKPAAPAEAKPAAPAEAKPAAPAEAKPAAPAEAKTAAPAEAKPQKDEPAAEKPAAAPAAEPAAAAAAEPAAEDELEEGEIRDDEPVVNGTATEDDSEKPPQKSAWQLQLEKMKEESIRIGVKLDQKKQYNRDDLMKLMVHPLSQKRPDQLPDLPSIVRPKDRAAGDARAFAAIKSRSMGPMTGMQQGDFGGGFKPLPNKPGYRGGRGSQQGRRDMPPQQQGPRQIQISLNRDVKLKVSENAWKASYKAPAGELDDDAKVIKAFKGILNKITPNTIERMTAEIKNLAWNTEGRLHQMIMTLFDKAVDEPMYADQYANICIAMGKTDAPGEDGKVVNFRKLLLTQCQTEFEKDKTSELNRDERQKEINAEKDEEKKKLLTFGLNKESGKIRHRSNGNIRFIGELYKLGMLSDRIMHQCIVKLVKDKHEDSYECLCKLMTTIGQKLEAAERSRNKDLSQMFNDFNRLTNDKNLASRIRFMLQDLIDMRKNNWVNTRTVGQAKPMTIDEVHKQARQQQAEAQAVLAQNEDRRRNDRGNDRGNDRRRGGGGGGGGGGGRDGRGSQGGGADGWNTVNRGRFDASRVLTAIGGSGSSQPDAGALKMGPGGGSSWSFGSKVGSGRRSGPAAPAQPEVRTTPNMFDMLQEDGGGGGAMAPIRLGPGGPSGGRMVPSRGSTGREGAKAAAPAAAAGSVLKGPATMDDEKMQGTVRLICGEYIDAKDFKTSVQDVEEKLHANTIAKFIGESLNKYVDARSTDHRHLLGELHRLLLESGHLTADAYLTGAKELLEIASDLACDIPSLWANIGELLAPPLTAGKGVTLEALATPAAAIVADNYGGKFVTGVLKRLKSLHGADKVRSLVPSSFDWKLYFGEKDHVKPLVNCQLGFLVAGANVPLSPEEAPPGKGVRSLLRTIQQEADVVAWVKKNVDEKDRTSAAFIKDMVCALCFDSIVIDNGAKKVLLERLEKVHGSLLKCLILDEESELVALYGVLALIRHLQYPFGVLDQCFRQLYDMEVISESAFLRWREGKEPAEQEGMGVALSGLKGFFKALEEEAAGDDDERT